ncbi:pentatricopeptide repeat-containing protein At2g13600-like [Aristolochia californica]|uniref:pentatricopeptide repeat-containing protein At2g13600-like n=1 Tax=Aristolochia californica TaxID=171875 RepID=UPI0035E2E95E
MVNLLIATAAPSVTPDFISHNDFPAFCSHPNTELAPSLSLSAIRVHRSANTNQKDLSLENPHNPPHGPVTSGDYAALIDSCNSLSFGRQIHGHVLKKGFGGHEFLGTKLLQMYGRCGSVADAVLLFDKMAIRNVYAWAGIFTVCTTSGDFDRAAVLFREMLLEAIELDFFVFPVILKACSGLNALEFGKQLHALLIKRQFVTNIYVGNALINMYGKCGCLDDGRKVLEKMPEKDTVSWNSVITGCAANGMVHEALEYLETMRLSANLTPNLVTWSGAIGGFAQNGYDREALELLYLMQEAGVKPSYRTFASILPACARLQNPSIGKAMHGYIVRHEYKSNSYVVNGLVDVYRRCGDMSAASKIFSKFSTRNVVSFNTMIVGYCEIGEVRKAKELFDQMKLFGVKKDTISWNSMISGYVDNGQFNEALLLFRDMGKEETVADSFTIGSILTACANMDTIESGKQIHSYAITSGFHRNSFVGGALVELYCTFGDLAAAQAAFSGISERDVANWNVLISGYSNNNQMEVVHQLLDKMQADGLDPNIYSWNGIIAGLLENGKYKLALQHFSEMQTGDMKPDIYTIGMALHACSKLSTIEPGKQIHAYSVRCGYDKNSHVGSTLVDMYAKCGTIKYADAAYNRISQQSVVSQNTMLTGYAMHRLWKEGISLFHQMLAAGIRPDAVTFLAVLALCAHAGAVNEGQEYFSLMGNYDINPTLKHYSCMVDLYSRAGLLNEANDLIKEMPEEPDAIVWGSLLNGCVIHRNIELGETAAKRLIELDNSNTGNYIMLANLYASAERWTDLARTWLMIKDNGMQKSPGCSWIEDMNQIHVFRASETSHKQTNEIYSTLDNLTLHMRQEGYQIQNYL